MRLAHLQQPLDCRLPCSGQRNRAVTWDVQRHKRSPHGSRRGVEQQQLRRKAAAQRDGNALICVNITLTKEISSNRQQAELVRLLLARYTDCNSSIMSLGHWLLLLLDYEPSPKDAACVSITSDFQAPQPSKRI